MIKIMIKQQKLFIETPVWKAIPKLAKFTIINYLGTAILWLITILLIVHFGNDYINNVLHKTQKSLQISQIVTSVGLSQIVISMATGFLVSGAVSGSSLLIQKSSLKKHEDVRKIINAIFSFEMIIIIFLLFFVSFIGIYIVMLQNTKLPGNYRVLAQRFLYLSLPIYPFFAYIYVASNVLVSDGHAWVNSITGLIPNIFFIAFMFLFNYGIPSAFHTNEVHSDWLFLINENGASLILGLGITALFLFLINNYYKRKGESSLSFKLSEYTFDIKATKIIFLNSLSIIARRVGINTVLIVYNTMLLFVPRGEIKPNNFQINNETYWQFFTSVTNPIFSFVLSGMFAIGGGGTRMLTSHAVAHNNYGRVRRIIKWGTVYTFSFLLICTLLIIIFAPNILNIFGIKDNAKYYVDNGVHRGTITATDLGSKSLVAMRVGFSTMPFFFLLPLLASYYLGTSNPKKAFLLLTIDKFVIELGVTVIAGFVAMATKYYLWFWIGYIFLDMFNFLYALIFLRLVLKDLKKRTKKYKRIKTKI